MPALISAHAKSVALTPEPPPWLLCYLSLEQVCGFCSLISYGQEESRTGSKQALKPERAKGEGRREGEGDKERKKGPIVRKEGEVGKGGLVGKSSDEKGMKRQGRKGWGTGKKERTGMGTVKGGASVDAVGRVADAPRPLLSLFPP